MPIIKKFSTITVLLIFISTTGMAQQIVTLGNAFPASRLRGDELIASFNKQTAKVIKLDERYKTDKIFHDGILTMQDWETGLYGFVNEQGDLLPGGFKWHAMSSSSAPTFSHGATIVKTRKRNASTVRGWDDSYFILYKDGSTKEIKSFGIIENATSFNADGVATLEIRAQRGTKTAYMNTQGAALYRNLWEELRTSPFELGAFNNGLARIYSQQTGRWGYINKQGQFVIPAKFSEAEDFSEGLAVVKTTVDNRQRYIYINIKGQQTISMSFGEKPSNFSLGYSVARKTDRTYVFIDKQGNVVSKGYKAMTPFYPCGRALVEDANGVHIINSSLQYLHNLRGSIYNYDHAEAPVCINGLFYLNGYCCDFEGNSCRVNGADWQHLASDNLIYVRFGSFAQPNEGFISRKTANLVIYIEKK